MQEKKPWAVILAGGEGSRLQSLTRFISGDGRPKQFCPIFGERTLLGETRARLSRLIPAERTLFVMQDAHRVFYKDEFSDVDPRLVLSQPGNKGTAAAIALAALRILALDKDATIAFFPADHYYDDDARFLAGLERAAAIAARNQRFLTLVGVEASSPEVEYGWIEPAAEWGEFARVRRFWEKPSLARAQDLLARGCLWNTFVMIGKARAFAQLFRDAAPRLAESVECVLREGGFESPCARHIFSGIAPADFSHHFLALACDRLLVFPLRGIHWSDLGKPERVIETLAEAGLQPRWAEAFSALSRKATA
ncbi:MAG TPA: sugar phosphate nucleotidyltransferase [Bryobacteraceae bacterium]|nr:sugar phosphate nucleotidyltransferase [Bryobacteraceae bacterium]